jgi:hypothetical protein
MRSSTNFGNKRLSRSFATSAFVSRFAPWINSSLMSRSFWVRAVYSSSLHDSDDHDREVEVAVGEQRVELFADLPVFAFESI